MKTSKSQKEIGIRELKTHTSQVVGRVAENKATYTVTRWNKPVAVLAPPDYHHPRKHPTSREAWDHVLALAEGIGRKPSRRQSAVTELTRARR